MIGELLKITKLYPEPKDELLDEPHGLPGLFCVLRIKQTHGDLLALWTESHTCCLICTGFNRVNTLEYNAGSVVVYMLVWKTFR